MNKKINKIYSVRQALGGLLVGALLAVGCTNQTIESEVGEDRLALLPANTAVGIDATIADLATRSGSTEYASNEIHSTRSANYTLHIPGGSKQTSFVNEGVTLEGLGSALQLQLNDFNLTTGNGNVVSRWTQLEATNGEDRLVGAARLDVDSDGNPSLDYSLNHARAKVTVRVHDVVNMGDLAYNEGITVTLSHQSSEADIFVKGEGGTLTKMTTVAASNTSDPADQAIADPTLMVYRTGEATTKVTTLTVPEYASGNPTTTKAIYSGVVDATPQYLFDEESNTLTALGSWGLTDEDFITITIDDDYAGLASSEAGGKYTLKLSDVQFMGTPLTSLKLGSHITITVALEYNDRVVATATIGDWSDSSADGYLSGDEGYLEGYTLSDNGKTYNVSQSRGLYAWAEAVANSAEKDINLNLECDIVLPAMNDGVSNWMPVGTDVAPYNGVINGNGHTIENLKMLTSDLEYTGFVGVLGGAGAIKNLVLGDATNAGGNYAGLFAGSNNYGVVENCHVVGNSSVGNNNTVRAAGIVASNYGLVMGCTNSASVVGREAAGVVCYNLDEGRVLGCANTGSIASVEAYGGIVVNNDNVVLGSWSSLVTVAIHSNNTGATNEDNYLFMSKENVLNELLSEMNKAIENHNATNDTATDCGYGWSEFDGSEWPSVVAIEDAYKALDYSIEGNTCTVYNSVGLLYWAEVVNGGDRDLNLVLAGDITMPTPLEGESNWTTVCGTFANPYVGTIEGNGYTITGLTVITNTSYVGFVGNLGTNGKISNVKFNKASIQGSSYVGVVAGLNYNGTIEGCLISSDSSVESNGNYAGTIVGLSGYDPGSAALIVACGSQATLTIGGNNSTPAYGTIRGCWATDSKDLGQNYTSNDARKHGCITGDAEAINAYVGDMNSALSGYGWQWSAGMDGSLPTLTKINQ